VFLNLRVTARAHALMVTSRIVEIHKRLGAVV